MMRTRLESRRGQTSAEYMLVVSVIVVALVAAGFVFFDIWTPAAKRFAEGMPEVYTDARMTD